MESIGRTVRRAFGPYERQVSELYRRFFIDLEDLAACIREWVTPETILEIGCGEGALAERLVRDFPNAHYTGIDIIAHLGRMYDGPADRVSFVQITAEELAKTSDKKYDLIVINDVMHHVPTELRAGILEAAREMLAPGGRLIFKDWVRRRTLPHLAVYVADVHIGGDKGVSYMTKDDQVSLIADCFGEKSILSERPINPWKQNLALLVAAADCGV
ncbi:class I SAM-dependent methyltransferase [Phaeovulum sp.]|uniref:class I SAM-dependent methyltransferase n=1 Tax=Phaeovulum sp. TaxID=2934796 RepID=UPI0039E6DE85